MKHENLLITKTDFVQYIRCHKMLWLQKFKKTMKSEMSESEKLNILEGHKVGDIALTHPKFAGGVLINELNPEKALEQSKNAFEKNDTAYEFAIKHIQENGLQLFLRVDILKETSNGFDLIEVKSSTSRQEVHFWDIAFQIYVMTKSNIRYNKIYIMKPNKDYIHNQDFNVEEYFSIEDVTKMIEKKYLPKVESILGRMVGTLNNKKEPQKVLGSHCKNPWNCPFASYCKKNINEDSVEKLSRLSEKKRIAFRKLNIKYLQQIPENYLGLFNELQTPNILSPKQQIQVQVAISGQEYIDVKKIKAFLKTLKFPYYHLDFEAYNKAIPEFDNMRPHQFVTFQASLHVEQSNGDLSHFEFIQDDKKDPRLPMIKFLLENIGKKGSIVVFNKSFEQTRIKELAKDFPQYEKDLLALNDRMVDLEIPFKNDYYNHSFEGRSSIKKVLPVLVPELSYDRLEVQNGAEAQAIYRNLINGKYLTESGKKGKMFFTVRKNLLDYCKLDTLAMVEILRKLKSKVA